MNWLHFVGTGLYTIPSFVKEAKAHGVSRRVPAWLLGKIRYNDAVYLFVKAGKRTSRIFGSFKVTRIYAAFPNSMIKGMIEAGILKRNHSEHGLFGDEQRVIKRKCGTFVIKAEYEATSLQAVGRYIEEHQGETEKITDLMIGGDYEEHPQFTTSIWFTRSTRPLDYEALMSDYAQGKANCGQYYVDGSVPPLNEYSARGNVITIEDYKKSRGS